MNDLHKLFIAELTKAYDFENQIIDALPKMADLAKSDELKQAFEHHLEQTKKQAGRVEEVFRSVDENPERSTCATMKALINESETMTRQFEDNTALDAGLISAAQMVEHLEIACYGTLVSWADELGYQRAADLLKENLDEEKQTDEQLTELAESSRNVEATSADTGVKSKVAGTIKKVFS